MIIRYFFDEKLAQAAYLVGCSSTGEAVVIDPLRDIEAYLRTAEEKGLRIVAVTETHIHADFLSGSRELAARTGARLYLSDEGGPDWRYSFGSDPNVVLMKDGHLIQIGNLSLKARHTPGHTPEHMVFLLTDHPASELVHSMFSGDFVFVGDVGRPDLLERAANLEGTMEAGARQLFASIQGLADLPDSLLIWPAHGAGSACGKALGGSPVSSLGYERASNWAFRVRSEAKFVDEVLAGQPEPPTYFADMKRLNKLGPAILGSMPRPKLISRPEGQLVDVRSASAIRAGLFPGTLAIPSNKGFTNWAGWLMDRTGPITLIADSQEEANQATRDMATIGLDKVAGWIDAATLSDAVPYRTITSAEVQANDLLVDVRGLGEWNEHHAHGARHIHLGRLAAEAHSLPKDRRLVVHCAGGSRSPIAYSILKAAGFENVVELPGGMMEIAELRPDLVEA